MNKNTGFLIIIILLSGCSCKNSHVNTPYQEIHTETEIHYLLSESGSWFDVIENIPEYSQRSRLPWPLQIRISDFIEFDNMILMGINGKGVALFNPDNPGFVQIESEKIFKNRTIGNLYSINNEIFCHVYNEIFFRNTDLYDQCSSSLGYLSSPLVKIDIIENSAVQTNKFSTEDHNPLNAVDLVFHNKMWYSASRIAAENSTGNDSYSFTYYRHDITGQKAGIITETEFLNAYSVFKSSEAPSPFRTVTEYLLKNIISDETILEISLPDRGSPETITYRMSGNESAAAGYEKIYADNNEKGEYFFTFRNNMYYTDREGNLALLESSVLPPGYRYTKLLCYGDNLIVSWEYQDFYKTGDSGFSIINSKKVDKLFL